MKLNIISLEDFLKQRELLNYTVDKKELKIFTDSLNNYRNKITPIIETDSEDTLKSILDKTFLSSLSHFDDVKANKKRIDLSMWTDDKLKVIIEAKTKSNKTEMITDTDINKKAFYETIYYFIEQTQKEKQNAIHSAMITDYQYIYLIEKVELQKLISPRSDIQLAFNESQTQKNSKDTFYKSMSTIQNNEEIKAIKFDLLNDDIELLYKIFDTPNIMHESAKADPNSLNKEFYNELLYIMGLKEKDNGLVKSDIKNTLLDLTMQNIDTDDSFEVALSLNILWLNRILFLKILESQLKVFRDDKDFSILDINKINDYSRLSKLFFKILSIPRNNRNEDDNQYDLIPYLNSSLFEETELEKQRNYGIIDIDKDRVVVLKKDSILHKGTTFNKTKLPLLEYLLRFLDCYQFNNDSDNADSNTVIKSSVLGLVFEKLNGYKDGSHFTPASITMYMSKEVIQRRVLDVFNKEFGYSCKSIQDLRDDLKSHQKTKAIELLNNISIIDPAVGSGHFLVSSLNELIRIKSDLGLLHSDIKVSIENDELLIKWFNGKPFIYQKDDGIITTEINEIQKAIFDTKKHIIENQLYGIDINPNSVNICRLRLWIELLKHTYYTNDSYIDLEVLPNLEFKIMTANSLYPLTDTLFFSDEQKETLRLKMKQYYNTSNKEKHILKQSVIDLIEKYKTDSANPQLENYHPFDTVISNDFFDSGLMFGIDEFDIVIGNPPYGAKISDSLKKTYKSIYETTKTIKNIQRGMTDTYNLFIEKGFNLLKKDGICSFIVPISVISASSASGIHRLLESKCEHISVSSYAVRPQQIFHNAVVDLSIITFIRTNTINKSILCTQMYRKSEDISVQQIVENLEFVDTKGLGLSGRYPKISKPIERDILIKLKNHKTKVLDIEQKTDGFPIYYRGTGGRYFKVVTNYKTGSSEDRELNIQKDLQNFVGALFSTTLFFWWYQILGDNRHITQDLVYNFPVPDIDNLQDINTLYDEYLQDIEKNSFISTTGVKIYKIVNSKHLIDKLDELIAPLYGLTVDEIEFIKNYELKFRMAGLSEE